GEQHQAQLTMPTDTPFHQLYFAAEGLPPGIAHVQSVFGREGISEGYAIDVSLELREGGIEPRAWLFKGAEVLVLRTRHGAVVGRYAGVVIRLAERASRSSSQGIVVTLKSVLSILELYRDYRIFQDMTTQEIVQKLLEDRGLDPKAFTWRLSGS